MTTKPLFTSFLFLLTMSSIVVSSAETININWRIDDYDDETANVGDTVRFTWGGNHNVYIHPTGTCSMAGRIAVGGSSPATYTFTANDAGKDIFFACDVGNHCETAQHVTFTVQGVVTDPPVTLPPVTSSPGPVDTCESTIGKWGLIKKFCKNAGKVDDGNDSTNTFWEIDESIPKKDVREQECVTDPCEPSECCVVGRDRTCANTDKKGKDKKFPNKQCKKGFKLDPKKADDACTNKDGFKCKPSDCCKKKKEVVTE